VARPRPSGNREGGRTVALREPGGHEEGEPSTPPQLSTEAKRSGMSALMGGSKIFYAVAAGVLVLFSATLMVVAVWHLLSAVLRQQDVLHQTLESIGLVTISIAVFEVAKFLLEEELIRERQLRSVLEARRSLTKFFTIIIITLSLEAIVLVFETKLERIGDLIYPTALMAVAVAAVIGLGLFQRLSADGGSNRIGEDRGGQT
jgi:hypothetical protein